MEPSLFKLLFILGGLVSKDSFIGIAFRKLSDFAIKIFCIAMVNLHCYMDIEAYLIADYAISEFSLTVISGL